jgi:alpha-L-rhamnosidase
MEARPLLQNFSALGFGCLLLGALSGPALADSDEDSWLIERQTGDLSWAQGTVPTPYGPIEVKWRKTSRGLHLEINVPNCTSGSVGLPMSSTTDSVTDNGQPVQKGDKMTGRSALDESSGARPGYTYLSGLGPGAHSIEIGQ